MTNPCGDPSHSLEVAHVTKSFNGRAVLRDVSLTIPLCGSAVGIIGPNGAGKTTLFNVILGLVTQTHGTVRLNGKCLDGLPAWRRAQLGLSCLWQDSRVFRNLTVMDNLLVSGSDNADWRACDFLFSRTKQNHLEQLRRDRAVDVLRRIGLEGRERSLARGLSYGQQRLLAFGRLLVNAPHVLLLDEPIAGLDPTMIDSVLALIHELRAEGKTVILIEHNRTAVTSATDVVYVMQEGRVAFHGAPEAVHRGLGLVDGSWVGL